MTWWLMAASQRPRSRTSWSRCSCGHAHRVWPNHTGIMLTACSTSSLNPDGSVKRTATHFTDSRIVTARS